MVSKTTRYDKPITEYPNVQAAIGKMTILYETARACIYRSLEHMRSGRADSHFDMTFSIAKYVVADHGKALIDIAMRIVGGRGYLEESRYSRDLADFSALITGAGTQDLLEVNLGVITTNDVLMRERTAK